MISLSIVIPFFNEEKSAPKLFSALNNFMVEQTDFSLELVLVNDGSADATGVLLLDFAEKHRETVRVISYPENKGKGYAVRTGMLGASGDWRLFMDADLAVPLDETKKILSSIADGCTIIIGSRVISGSLIEVPQGRMRSFLGAGFTFLASMITGVRVSDFTCGFKCFSKEVTQMIFPQAKIDRWSYDAEILYIAKKHALKICEIPVIWRNGPETKVRLWGMAQAFVDLFRIIHIHH